MCTNVPVLGSVYVRFIQGEPQKANIPIFWRVEPINGNFTFVCTRSREIYENVKRRCVLHRHFRSWFLSEYTRPELIHGRKLIDFLTDSKYQASWNAEKFLARKYTFQRWNSSIWSRLELKNSALTNHIALSFTRMYRRIEFACIFIAENHGGAVELTFRGSVYIRPVIMLISTFDVKRAGIWNILTENHSIHISSSVIPFVRFVTRMYCYFPRVNHRTVKKIDFWKYTLPLRWLYQRR